MTTSMFEKQSYRTDADNRYSRDQLKGTYPGMAHVSGTADVVSTCRYCQHFTRTSPVKIDGFCAKYVQLSSRPNGSLRFPGSAKACSYFERAKQ